MQLLEQFLSPELMQALGWALLHSLWQGAVIALLLGGMFLCLQGSSAKFRYGLSLSGLAAMLVWFVATFWQMYAVETAASFTTIALVQEATIHEIVIEEQTAATSTSFWEAYRAYFNTHLPFIVTLWFLGVVGFSLRFLGGLAYIQRLKYRHQHVLSSAWSEMLEDLKIRLNIKRVVQLAESRMVQAPMMIGYFKPIILLPIGTVNNLNVKEVEAILAHELAHIYRHDYLVNILQSIVETIFFYHPAVWWLSAHIQEERENCCDDIAIQLTGDSVSFAKALASLEQLKIIQPRLSMGITGRKNRLLHRIKRLLNPPKQDSSFVEGFVAACILVVCLWATTMNGQITDEKNAPDVPLMETTVSEEIEITPDVAIPTPIAPEIATEPVAPTIGVEVEVLPPMPAAAMLPKSIVAPVPTMPTLPAMATPPLAPLQDEFIVPSAPKLPLPPQVAPLLDALPVLETHPIIILQDTAILGENEVNEVIIIKTVEEDGEEKEVKVFVKNFGDGEQVEVKVDGQAVSKSKENQYKIYVDKAMKVAKGSNASIHPRPHPKVHASVAEHYEHALAQSKQAIEHQKRQLERQKEQVKMAHKRAIEQHKRQLEMAKKAQEKSLALRTEQLERHLRQIERQQKRNEERLKREEKRLSMAMKKQTKKMKLRAKRLEKQAKIKEKRLAKQQKWVDAFKKELIKDGITKADSQKFSLKINNKGFWVNGKKQADSVKTKYKKLYRKITGKDLQENTSIRIKESY